jgi:hypothetical protein
MFDDIAASVASTLSGVFGAVRSYSRGVEFTVVVRRDIEAIDDAGQVVGRTNTVRIAHSDIDFTPKRGDTIIYGSDTFTLGRRLADDRYAYLFEATT